MKEDLFLRLEKIRIDYLNKGNKWGGFKLNWGDKLLVDDVFDFIIKELGLYDE